MQKKLDEQRKELAEAKTETEEMATPESSSSEILEVYQSAEKSAVKTPPTDESKKALNEVQSALSAKQVLEEVQTAFKDEVNQIQETKAEISAPKKTLEVGGKLYVNKVVQLVVSQATDKVSSKHKLFTERLTPDCISHRLIEKIWPEIENKHVDLSPKRLKNVNKAIFKALCKSHNCKDKYLIFSLREELDSITVPIFTKHLLALPRRVLSVSKNRDEYREFVQNFTKALVILAMAELNQPTMWYSGICDWIIQRLSQKIWNNVLSKNYKISLENFEELAFRVYDELNQMWDYPGQLMELNKPMTDEIIVKAFKKHATLKRQNIISRAFSFAR